MLEEYNKMAGMEDLNLWAKTSLFKVDNIMSNMPIGIAMLADVYYRQISLARFI